MPYSGWGGFEAWETPGWTAQNFAYPPASVGLPGHPQIPESIDVVTVFGRLVDHAGRGREGYMRFRCRTRLWDSASDITILPAEIRVKVEDGHYSADLLTSNDPDLDEPNTIVYEVTEGFLGGEKYTIEIPHGTASPVSVESLRHAPVEL